GPGPFGASGGHPAGPRGGSGIGAEPARSASNCLRRSASRSIRISPVTLLSLNAAPTESNNGEKKTNVTSASLGSCASLAAFCCFVNSLNFPRYSSTTSSSTIVNTIVSAPGNDCLVTPLFRGCGAHGRLPRRSIAAVLIANEPKMGPKLRETSVKYDNKRSEMIENAKAEKVY